ncbi:putative cysteine--tRNA ligase, mitochondrial isoform X3 [Callithrix jacchus]
MLRTPGPGLGAPLLLAALGLGRAGWRGPAGRPASGGRGKAWLQPTGRDTGVQVYNSLTGRKEPLIVAHAEAASWYSCGPTVYDHAHLGHACSYVRFDIIRRILTKVFGCNIVMVMGITDVDDKIIKRANEMNISPASLASLYEEDFKQDMAALKVLPPTVYLRVTENIPQIVSFIEGIIARGHAYSTAKGNVYFDLKSRGDKYGKLVSVAPGPAGEPADSDKRHPSDFALWKAAKPQEVFWASPWGPGRPGWHIECSAIASMVFGSQLDIHSGGIDLAFPHHENEIAQCEVFHQCEQWGNYFLHSGHLHMKGKEEKMSKSLKNYVTIKSQGRGETQPVRKGADRHGSHHRGRGETRPVQKGADRHGSHHRGRGETRPVRKGADTGAFTGAEEKHGQSGKEQTDTGAITGAEEKHGQSGKEQTREPSQGQRRNTASPERSRHGSLHRGRGETRPVRKGADTGAFTGAEEKHGQSGKEQTREPSQGQRRNTASPERSRYGSHHRGRGETRPVRKGADTRAITGNFVLGFHY